jgi:hypothetical protein
MSRPFAAGAATMKSVFTAPEGRMATDSGSIDFNLLRRLSHLLLCSGCLRLGIRTPVPQVISPRHVPRSLCPACRAREVAAARRPAAIARLPLG